MNDFQDTPDTPLKRAEMLERILSARATGEQPDENLYKHLRNEFITDQNTKELLPPFVNEYRSLSAFWRFIKEQETRYAGRLTLINNAFTPLIDYLMGQNNAPSDDLISEALKKFDADSVHAVWAKALKRRDQDPGGTITLARTLLETVLKRILDETKQEYTKAEDLPKLYQRVSKHLNLAPNQHAEQPIKEILGSVTNLVNGIGTLRNRLSDAHGRNDKLPVRPSARHANLAINSAGAIATFLVETFNENIPQSSTQRPIPNEDDDQV